MKIGILTFHCAHNYGAVLQAYASKCFLEKNGHEVYFIDYRPNKIISKYKLFTLNRFFSKSVISSLRKLKHEIPLLKKRINKYNDFKIFTDKILLENGNKSVDLFNGLEKLDCYFLGSDQIWNISLLGYFDEIYWGNFPLKKPMFTYAVSLEENIPDIYNEKINNSLLQFKSISVREDVIKDVLLSKFNINSTVVLDPTFLIEQDDWIKIEQPLKIPNKYVLLYYFGVTDYIINEAEIFANKHNCRLLIVSIGVSNDVRYINSVRPENFIYLFHHASFVITNSFHGTAFSIIFKRPFYVIKKKGTSNYRINQLCNSCNLTERIIDNFNSYSIWNDKIDIDNTLFGLKNKSQIYILDTIKSIK